MSSLKPRLVEIYSYYLANLPLFRIWLKLASTIETILKSPKSFRTGKKIKLNAKKNNFQSNCSIKCLTMTLHFKCRNHSCDHFTHITHPFFSSHIRSHQIESIVRDFLSMWKLVISTFRMFCAGFDFRATDWLGAHNVCGYTSLYGIVGKWIGNSGGWIHLLR